MQSHSHDGVSFPTRERYLIKLRDKKSRAAVLYAWRMFLLRMMLRLFTSIFGTTHPCKEDEAKYAWMLFGMIVIFIAAMAGMTWVMLKVVR
jgi:hypothetical protein